MSDFIKSSVLVEDDPPPRKFRNFGDNDPSPSETTSLSDSTSHAPEIPLEVAGTSLSDSTSLSEPEGLTLADEAASLTYGAAHIRIPHDYLERILASLSGSEMILYLWLLRYREGGGSQTIVLNWPLLTRRSGLATTTLYRAARQLEAKGMARQSAPLLGKGKEQGFRFWVFFPTSLSKTTSLSNSTDNKRTALKDKSKKGAPALCPDCSGTGFWYPAGTEKGVARCRHDRMK